VVFFKTLFRIADGADDAGAEIIQAVDVVYDLGRQGGRGIRG
jgi:hypothetical protein